MTRKHSDRQQPWLLLIEFPSHADAQAAQELLAEQFPEEIFLRPKQQHPSDGNVANWRLTHILREELGNRSFGREGLDAALLTHNYASGGNKTWLTIAVRAGIIERLARGEYRFLPLPTGAVAQVPTIRARHDPQCTACQPEELRI